MAIGIGETLRAARRERGLTLTDAAAETRIRHRYLAALEDEEFESLGEDVYAKGFLRSYARYLGLDAEPLLAEYRRSYSHETDEVAALTTPPVAQERAPLPRPVRVVASAGALVLLLAVVAVLGDGGDPTAEPPPLIGLPTDATPTPPASPAPPAATAAPQEEEEEEEEAPAGEPDRTGAPVAGVEVRVVVAGGTSWLRAVVDGDVEVEGIQPDGTTLEFSADEEVSLRVGNAGAVRLVVDGEDLGPAGSSGEVVDLTYRADTAEGASA